MSFLCLGRDMSTCVTIGELSSHEYSLDDIEDASGASKVFLGHAYTEYVEGSGLEDLTKYIQATIRF
jgi:hypothetical protein